MSILDDLPAEIYAELAGEFYDGTLHIGKPKSDSAGGYTIQFTDRPIKCIVDSYSETYRSQNGIPDTDVSIVVLQYGVTKVIYGIEPWGKFPWSGRTADARLDSQISVRGVRYSIHAIDQDPARATWTIRGRPI